MTEPLFGDAVMEELMDAAVPMPYQGYAEPAHVARVIAFLASAETMRITGQVVFVDGGADVALRGDDVW
jgi:NAD(P)-dependent dehydrogenase (short-subunit alcohol dehydrogenase family)